MSSTPAVPGDNELAVNDLGPLAWVLDELRKSLDGATKAMRRFVRDAELARGSDLTELDASHLRVARQQLHQAVGALEMVGLEAPAKVLRAMEALAQRFVQRPELCSDDAANRLERASFALTEYLEGVLKGKNASAVALFPQYRAVMELSGADRIHPADLWPPQWQWLEVNAPVSSRPKTYTPEVRQQLDRSVLQLVKYGDVKAAQRLYDLTRSLAAGQTELEPRTFWNICAAFFEGAALRLYDGDVYTKRASSRILQQFAALAKGKTEVSERLAQDLVFFCSRAVPKDEKSAPVLQAVRQAYGLVRTKPVNYETEQFGRFDPAVLALARKRIATAAETWSALAGGDTNRLKVAAEHFGSVCESIVKLHPESDELARALTRVIDSTVRSGAAPVPAVAMEVATSVLYLEAAYEDLDPTESQLAERGARLAQRLDRVSGGAEPEPMEGWMEDLYRRVSDRQTMGSVVDELRTNLAEVEKSLDQFFRSPNDKAPLREVPSQLAQMRGVFSVLGLDQPALAALRMRSSVDQFIVDEIDVESARTGIFEKLGNSLGAMGFLIDMLSYQRALAKKFFVYDEELGELRPLMGREKAAAHSAPEGAPVVQAAPAPRAPQPAPAPYVPAPSSAASSEEDDGELTDIFLEEAREVVQKGREALQALVEDPTNLADQTTLRRAFHTLKGSSRMVGLNDFGEAAWAFEQVLNTSLAEQRPASDAMISVAGDALRALGHWVEDIAGNTGVKWNPQDFRECADALRLRNTQLPLKTPVPLDSIEASPSPKLVDLPLLAEDESSPSSAYPEFADTKTVKEDEGGPESQGGFSATEIPGDLLPDLEIPLSDFPSIPTVGDASTDSHAASSAKAAFNAATEVIEGDLGDFDFGDLGAQPPAVDTVAPAAPVATTATEEFSLELPDLSDYSEHTASASLAEPEVPVASPEPRSPLPEFEQETDDGIKVIGPLRLSIPLYNVYLNEADEWSRRLQTELSEWALEVQKPLPDAVVSLAHSLLGSSATVGFVALSEMARALEQALQHVQLHRQGTAEQATVFCNAAEDIRRLLHQFAAGFLKEADDGILEALQRIIETEFPAATMESAPASLPEVALPDDWAATGMESLQDLVIEPEPETQAAALSEPVMEPVAETVTEAAPLAAYEPELAPVLEPIAEQVPVAPVAVPAPLNVAQAQDVDIDAVDSLDPDLLPIFEEEAQELMPQMGTALRQWMARPDNLSARSEVLRLLHTLKGSARLAGAMRLGEMSHHMESSIEQIGTENLQAVQIEPLLTRFDTLQNTFANLGKSEEELDAQAPVAALPTAPESVKDVAKDAAKGAATPARKVDIQSIAQTHILTPVRSTGNQSVRVRSQLLDRLVNQAGEVMISRSRMDSRLTQLRTSLGELDGNLDRLRKQLRDVELQAESQMQSRLAQTKDSAQAFDPLEFDRFTRVQELTRMMAESVNDVATVQRNLQRSVEGTEDDLIAQGRQARELQRDLLKTRMVEFEGISDRLYGVVRQAAKDTGKQVKLDITGGTIEMDRGVLERMAPAFEHMLRNAVAHGVEEAASRTAAGKSAAGGITINVAQESNDVSVTFSDDGAGLNFDKIRSKAIANGLIKDSDNLSEGDVANLIFTPGFSTADQVTELAGRGIGMDIVRSEVNALGGRIETSATQGKGTSFKLVLPLTTAVTQVVIMRIGTFSIGVPANLLETILRVPSKVLDESYARDGFDFAGDIIPFYWAGALLQESARSHEATGKTLPVAIFRSAGQRLAMHVDEVLGNREVVVKNLGPQLARLPGLAGMSVLASGAVVLIYNPVALATVYGEQAKQFGKASAQEPASEAAGDTPTSTGAAAVPDQLPLVLVVDDSITVRRVTQRLLKREGYRVALANDGLQAIERLQEEKPAVVLSDIEMPRMDGFDLARNIRGDARLSDLPIIMITSRIADKHREHARQLGVDHYLGKPYSEEELLGLIRGYCAVPAAN